MKWLLAFVLAAALFFVANRGAYEGYFSDDDLDNMAWTRSSSASTFVWGLLAPKYYPQHFRPVGHATFHVLSELSGLRFKTYIGLVHLLHLINVALLFMLLRRIGLTGLASAFGALFFIFPMAAFDAIWKPMYLFDVWCAFFSLGCLLAWTHQRYVLSFLCFWFAFKSKELAVMLPAVLALYEWWLGSRKWKPLIPFFLLAAVFGLQGVLFNKEQGEEYRLHLTPWTFVRTASFYTSRILIYPWLGLALALLPALIKDKRVWFGVAAAGLLLVPLLPLDGRMFAAYLYLPLAMAAVAIAALLSRTHWAVSIAVFCIWLPFNYMHLRTQRKAALTYAQENKSYVEQTLLLPAKYPEVRRFIMDGHPPAFNWWGVQGALRWAYRTLDLELTAVDSKDLNKVFEQGAVALLSWEPGTKQMIVTARQPGQADESYIRMGRYMPLWQLGEGWYQAENKYRWSAPHATARLYRPEGAKTFALEVNVGPQYIAAVKLCKVRLALDGKQIGEAAFDKSGWQTVQFPVETGPPSTVRMTLDVEPPFQPNNDDPRRLGIAVGGFGFVAR